MNKPETKSAQSLEEILASIRKALAEEEVQGGPEAPASPEPVRPADKPAEKKTLPAAKADPLPGQLAMALNGSGTEQTEQNATDDDLADLLAPLPAQAAKAAPDPERSPPASDDKDKSEDKDKKDPLWFLARKDAPESEPAKAEVKETEKPNGREDAVPKPAESTLTRLETLRSSLPPLFGVEETATAKAEPVNYVPPAPKSADLPELAPPRKAREEKLEPKPEVKVPPAEKAPAAQAMGPELPTPGPLPLPPSGVLHPPAGAAPPVEAPAAPADPRPGAAKASPLGSDQARALEAMIGQLIGPVIHSWLDANLPRLVEKVVREEVARTSGKKPDVGKD